MKCSNCGNEVKKESKFCPNCGKVISGDKKEASLTSKKDDTPIALGVLSLVFSWLFIVGIPLSIIGLVTYKKQLKNHENPNNAGKVLSIIGLVLNIVVLIAISFVFFISTLAVKNTFSKVSKIKNQIEENKTRVQEGYKRVGKENYGFINVPDTWEQVNDVTDTDKRLLQYGSEDKTSFITMNYYNESDEITIDTLLLKIQDNLKNNGATNIAVSSATINNFSSNTITCSYSNTNLHIWLFEDSDKIIHYVTIESKDDASEAFDYIDSYAVNK